MALEDLWYNTVRGRMKESVVNLPLPCRKEFGCA